MQACNRVRSLCQHIRRVLEEERDPRILDILVFQIDLLIYHLNQMRVQENPSLTYTIYYS